MRIPLDTHAWLWAVGDRRKLSARARRLVEDPRTEVWLSPLSVWEAALFHARDRIDVDESFERWVELSLENLRCREATLTHRIVLEARVFSLPHADPADRLLVATARSLGLRLLTADRLLLDSAGAPTLPAA